MIRVVLGIVFITICYLSYKEYKRHRRLKDYEERVKDANVELEAANYLDEAVAKELQAKAKMKELEKLQEETKHDSE